MTYLNTALICWVPIGAIICLKQCYDVYINMKNKTKHARNIRKELTDVVENTIKDEVDFTSIKLLREKSETGTAEPPLTNPRKPMYKDVKS